jgi:hypothetical protein
MSNSRSSAADPEILALCQECLLLIRRKLSTTDLAGAPELLLAIKWLAGASYVHFPLT